MLAFMLALLALLPAACEERPEKAEPEKPEPAVETLVLERARFDDLPGWRTAGFEGVREAFGRSCAIMTRSAGSDGANDAVPLVPSDWEAPCAGLADLAPKGDDGAARAYFERHFQPYRATDRGRADGLFTGYFEAELRGARTPSARYPVPLYRLPEDHVRVDLGVFDESLKGRHVVGRVVDGRLQPYHDRGTIDAGALVGRSLELAWVDDRIDAFLLQVQGSGRILLPDGDVMRVGFAGHNGRGYKSIGRALIERGALTPDGASWDHIRDWLDENPDEAAGVLALNPRYIFFREQEGEGPMGAQGVALTPGRSLAVDRRFVPLGLPIWLDTTWPGAEERPLRTLLIAQDTGNAITGPVRGDYFWGYGADALARAGRMKSRGQYYLLLPKSTAARRDAQG